MGNTNPIHWNNQQYAQYGQFQNGQYQNKWSAYGQYQNVVLSPSHKYYNSATSHFQFNGWSSSMPPPPPVIDDKMDQNKEMETVPLSKLKSYISSSTNSEICDDHYQQLSLSPKSKQIDNSSNNDDEESSQSSSQSTLSSSPSSTPRAMDDEMENEMEDKTESMSDYETEDEEEDNFNDN